MGFWNQITCCPDVNEDPLAAGNGGDNNPQHSVQRNYQHGLGYNTGGRLAAVYVIALVLERMTTMVCYRDCVVGDY